MDSDLNDAFKYVNDRPMAMRILLNLANKNTNKYIMKKFITTDFVSLEEMHGYRENNCIGGNVWVIGKKDVLEQIDNQEYYFGSSLANIMKKMLEDFQQSLIIFTDYYYEENVKPRYYDSENIKIKTNETAAISCFLFDDELKQAVYKFQKFINQNGADIKGIDEYILFQLIDNVYLESGKIIKK